MTKTISTPGTLRRIRNDRGLILEAIASKPTVSFQNIYINDLFELENDALENEILLQILSSSKSTPSNITCHCQEKDALFIIDKGIPSTTRRKVEYWCLEYGYRYIVCPGGEEAKILATIVGLIGKIKDNGISRFGVLIGVGGGAVLDAVGAVALIYRRGLTYVSIPTTLLAVVDAGIGVKTGMNFDGSKNFLGGFNEPGLVLSDISFLETLDSAQRRAGFAEILKIALISSSNLFETIERLGEMYVINGQIDKHSLISLVERSASELLKQLLKDLYEADPRRLVDLGHELAHPLEELTHYNIGHGDAVALGILISSKISLNRNLLSYENYERISTVFEKLRFPLPDYSNLKELSKKVVLHTCKHKGFFFIVLPIDIGRCEIHSDVTVDEFYKACQEVYQQHQLQSV